MPCFSPLFVVRPLTMNENGKRPIIFTGDINSPSVPGALKMAVPCGRCIGCRLERSRVWALRCIHEASLYDDNCFITLTFSDIYLHDWHARNLKLDEIQPALKGSLCKTDFQNFMKRLRFRFPDIKIRYFHCGEYGSDNGRPHHHACLFNFRFPDLKPFITQNGSKVFVSEILGELWPYGFTYVGDVTFESAAYVARYVLKKWARQNLHGKELYDAMVLFDKDEGDLKAEYVTMSRRPGIGSDWIEKNFSDVYPKDFVTVRGKKCKPPKFYDLKKELQDQDFMLKLKYQRTLRYKSSPDNSLSRLKVREKVVNEMVKRKVRRYEESRV